MTAYVFPGQGSQFVGMLSELASQHPIITEIFSTVSERVGYDVWHLVQHGPEEMLSQTEHTQVAMLTADVAVYNVLKTYGAPAPKFMAGHSLGEYAALVCAGAITLSDAAALVSMRGRLMQDTVPLGIGAMAAIVGLSDDDVRTLCSEASTLTSIVTPANYNAIGQVVIAGHSLAVEQALVIADGMGARLAKKIAVSVPCHCPLLFEATDIYRDYLQSVVLNVPQVPVISNVDLSIYESTEQIRQLLTAQLHQPVRWVETIQLMQHQGVTSIVECGPGKVLSGLIKRIDNRIQAMSVHDVASLKSMLLQLNAV